MASDKQRLCLVTRGSKGRDQGGATAVSIAPCPYCTEGRSGQAEHRTPVGYGVVGLVQIEGAVHGGQAVAAAAATRHELRRRRRAQPRPMPRVDLDDDRRSY